MQLEIVTEERLADLLELPLAKVQDLRRRHDWPHTRLGKSEVRYTGDQVRAVLALHARGSMSRPRGLPGQTPLSIIRHQRG